ncbi:MAG: glutaredoxin domain-containing protein [Methanocellales archaeon]
MVIKAYTLSTCPYCTSTKQLFEKLGVGYEFIDVDLLTARDESSP